MSEMIGSGRSRRRGAELEHALYAAALAELTETGHAGLTIEGVAARARTGKAAVYRRWPSKRALVLDALRHAMPPIPQPDPRASARENLRTMFNTMCGALAGDTSFPGLTVAVGLLGDPTLRVAVVDALIAPRLSAIESILRQAEQAGEVASGTLPPMAAQVGPALIMHIFLLSGAPPSAADLTRILDTVLPPTAASTAR